MYTYKIWDGTSAINGIEAEVFKREYKMSGNQKAYMVYRDEKLVYFQPHNPFEAGVAVMDGSNIDGIAKQHVIELTERENRFNEDASEIALLEKQLAEMQEIINTVVTK